MHIEKEGSIYTIYYTYGYRNAGPCVKIYIDNLYTDGLTNRERKKILKTGNYTTYNGIGRMGYYTLSGHYNFSKFPGGDGWDCNKRYPSGQWSTLDATLMLVEFQDQYQLKVTTSLGDFMIGWLKVDNFGTYYINIKTL